MAIAEFPATGQLRVVCGKAGADDEDPQFEVRVRAPGAPDMVICSGPWPEGEPDEEWRNQIGTWIELIRASLRVAAARVPALTAVDVPPAPDLGAA